MLLGGVTETFKIEGQRSSVQPPQHFVGLLLEVLLSTCTRPV